MASGFDWSKGILSGMPGGEGPRPDQLVGRVTAYQGYDR
jgi:hypothetical protein